MIAHTRAHIGEHTYESTYESTHMRAHIGAGAAETHMDRSQEPFCAEIYRKNAAHYSAHLD